MPTNEQKIFQLFFKEASGSEPSKEIPAAERGTGLTPAEVDEMWEMAMDLEYKGG